ncbi:MAG TPA: PEMT/PEM2 methyltransferase family protein [Candidatus Eisenbacteria bacterium]|nr:PEMT/PEM2 methyltransferase family protein [Candidatus Eisenbacteria bacterium]
MRPSASRIPDLGPNGEGWVTMQFVGIALVVVADQLRLPMLLMRGSAAMAAVALGWGLIAAGAVLFASALYLLWRAGSFTALPRPIPTSRFVRSGPYRLVRHPVYSGLVLGAIGLALVRLSTPTLVAALLLFVILDLKRRREEIWLAERFAEYELYRRETRALIPLVY